MNAELDQLKELLDGQTKTATSEAQRFSHSQRS
jgi:hypothetical protein